MSPNYIKNDFFLLYSQHFNRDKGLDYGRLSINSLSEGTRSDDIWLATSSTATRQGKESFHLWGGMLPPQYRCPDLKVWQVDLQPIPLHHVKGVQSNFYRLLPHTVVTDASCKRSDFGIHLDGNVPGSLGCIVLDKKRFALFERRISEIRALDIFKLPLFVQYS